MCGRYFYSLDNKELKEIFEEAERELYEKAKEGVIYPSDIVPILINKKGAILPVLAKWGFVTSQGKVINSRVETVKIKPTTRNLIETKKCVIPASAFYEWKKTNENIKDKYVFYSGNTVLYMAGLYNTVITENRQISIFDDGMNTKKELLFTILTKDANESVKKIHDRMPVILTKEEVNEWLIDNNFDDVINKNDYKLESKKLD